jgi:anaerobic ribonucleoside-triphosphate reductase activating protein
LSLWLREARSEVDILCYSGYPERRLRARHGDILAALDAVIPNPFVARRAPGGAWRGSSNQRLVPLSALGRERYGNIPDDPPPTPQMQVVVDDGIGLIGIPRPGDMEALERLLRVRGIVLHDASWRP